MGQANAISDSFSYSSKETKNPQTVATTSQVLDEGVACDRHSHYKRGTNFRQNETLRAVCSPQVYVASILTLCGLHIDSSSASVPLAVGALRSRCRCRLSGDGGGLWLSSSCCLSDATPKKVLHSQNHSGGCFCAVQPFLEAPKLWNGLFWGGGGGKSAMYCTVLYLRSFPSFGRNASLETSELCNSALLSVLVFPRGACRPLSSAFLGVSTGLRPCVALLAYFSLDPSVAVVVVMKTGYSCQL